LPPDAIVSAGAVSSSCTAGMLRTQLFSSIDICFKFLFSGWLMVC